MISTRVAAVQVDLPRHAAWTIKNKENQQQEEALIPSNELQETPGEGFEWMVVLGYKQVDWTLGF